jgi:putative flippase GtrA
MSLRNINHRCKSAPHLIKFLFVGGTATLLQLLLLTIAIELEIIQPIVASALSYCISAIYNYLLNYWLTFNSTKSHTETFPKFAIVTCIGASINTLVFAGLLNLAGHYIFAQAVAILVTLIINFILHKYWIYRN